MWYDKIMKRMIWVILVLSLLSGCFNQPQGFRLTEPGGYNFTTGNQRDHYNYERYANGKAAVTITLRMVELPGPVYDPAFDPQAFFTRIGWDEAILLDDPVTVTRHDTTIIAFSVQRTQERVTLWVINLNSPVDVWAEVKGSAEEVRQAFEDWIDVWESLEFIYF
jgi:hypothetical protein